MLCSIRRTFASLTLLGIMTVGASSAFAGPIGPATFLSTNGGSTLSVDYNEALSTSSNLVWDVTRITGSGSFQASYFRTSGPAFTGAPTISNLVNITNLFAFGNSGSQLSGWDDNGPGAASYRISMAFASPIPIGGTFTGYFAHAAGAGVTETNFTISNIPEPATLTLLGLGLAGLGFRRRLKT